VDDGTASWMTKRRAMMEFPSPSYGHHGGDTKERPRPMIAHHNNNNANTSSSNNNDADNNDFHPGLDSLPPLEADHVLHQSPPINNIAAHSTAASLSSSSSASRGPLRQSTLQLDPQQKAIIISPSRPGLQSKNTTSNGNGNGTTTNSNGRQETTSSFFNNNSNNNVKAENNSNNNNSRMVPSSINIPAFPPNKTKVLRHFTSGRSLSEITSLQTLRHASVVQYLADAIAMGFHIDWSRFMIKDEYYNEVNTVLKRERKKNPNAPLRVPVIAKLVRSEIKEVPHIPTIAH
jgi:hypothetical protein